MEETFFTQEFCDRCHSKLDIRKMSWFTNETICMECIMKESEIKRGLKRSGDTTNYEGCGYIPEVKEGIE